MKKEKRIHIDIFTIFMSISLVLLLVVWIIKDNPKQKKVEILENTNIKTVSEFEKKTLKDVNEIIKSKELVFVYLGYEGCGSCDKFVPTLDEVADDYNIKVLYIDTKLLDKNSKEWSAFTAKLTKKITLNLKINGEAKKITKTIGKFLADDGYTPTFVVFKDNKIIDGNIGGLSKDKLSEFLENAGYKK